MQKIFLFVFDLLYNQFAWAYDLVAWVVSGGLWKKWIYSTLPYLKDGNILELGYGPGHLQKIGRLQHKKIFGVDISPYMAEICAKRLSATNLPLQIMLANAYHLPFLQNSFHQVIATFPAPYIFSNVVLAEINRVLNMNGELLIIPTAWSTSKFPVRVFFSWLFNLSSQGNNDSFNNSETLSTPLKNFGFAVSHQILNIKKSKVVLIIARKIE